MQAAGRNTIAQWRRRPQGFLHGCLLLRLSALMLTLSFGSLMCAAPPSQSPGEYQVKAAFLYNFAKFIEWPTNVSPDPNSPFILGIVGDDPFGSDLEQTISGKGVNGRRLLVKRFKRGQALEFCHILFISSSEQGRVPQILGSLKGFSVLTVGEVEQFTRSGGIINFTLKDDKVRFEINLGAAERAGLRISSKLLKLGEVVGGGIRGN